MRRVVSLALALLVVACALHVAFAREWGADDAYISYRYAQNFTAGHGLVFNPGERVEGYTNLLYVLVVAAGARLFHAPHYATAVLVNAAALAAILVVLVRHVAGGAGGAGAVLAARWAGAFVVLCPVFYRWVTAGLEAPVVLLLQVLLWVNAERSVRDAGPDGGRARGRIGLATLCGAAFASVLVRADGVVFPAVTAAYLLVHRRWRAGLAVAGTAAATLAADVAWRLAYYGAPLPNTYYAKVSGPLLQRLAHGAGDSGGARGHGLPPPAGPRDRGRDRREASNDPIYPIR